MSEYQYYEFLALDRPLTPEQRAERDGYPDAFSQRFAELRARHERKPTLQERFDRAGLG